MKSAPPYSVYKNQLIRMLTNKTIVGLSVENDLTSMDLTK
jgi:hypothetical protein